MTWAGIDYDSHAVHIVRVEEGQPRYYPCLLEGDDYFERLRRVPWEMPGEGFWDDVVAVGIEEPGGKYVVAKLKGIQGAIVACLPSDLLVQPYQAGLWRKLCGLKGNATKEDVRGWVLARLPEDPHWPQDAYDAYCLAHAVSEQVEVMR